MAGTATNRAFGSRSMASPGLRNLKCRLASLGLMVATYFHSQKDQGQGVPTFLQLFQPGV